MALFIVSRTKFLAIWKPKQNCRLTDSFLGNLWNKQLWNWFDEEWRKPRPLGVCAQSCVIAFIMSIVCPGRSESIWYYTKMRRLWGIPLWKLLSGLRFCYRKHWAHDPVSTEPGLGQGHDKIDTKSFPCIYRHGLYSDTVTVIKRHRRPKFLTNEKALNKTQCIIT